MFNLGRCIGKFVIFDSKWIFHQWKLDNIVISILNFPGARQGSRLISSALNRGERKRSFVDMDCVFLSFPVRKMRAFRAAVAVRIQMKDGVFGRLQWVGNQQRETHWDRHRHSRRRTMEHRNERSRTKCKKL